MEYLKHECFPKLSLYRVNYIRRNETWEVTLPQFPFYGEGAADFDIDRFHKQFGLQQIVLDSCPKVQYMQTIQLDLLCQL